MRWEARPRNGVTVGMEEAEEAGAEPGRGAEAWPETEIGVSSGA